VTAVGATNFPVQGPRTRYRYADLIGEAEEGEDPLVAKVVSGIAKAAEAMLDVASDDEWLKDYRKFLQSSEPIGILHFNVQDFAPVAIHVAAEAVGKPFLVVHLGGAVPSFFYQPPAQRARGHAVKVHFQEYVIEGLPRGEARLIFWDFDQVLDEGRIKGNAPQVQTVISSFMAGKSYAPSGNKLVILVSSLEGVPTSLASSARIIELPYPDLKAREKITQELAKVVEGAGLKFSVDRTRLAFFLGGLTYADIKSIVTAAVARAKMEGRREVTDADIAREKRERTESLATLLEPVRPNFKWKWYESELVKRIFERYVINPIEAFAEAREFGSSPATGILLMGPPGTGKSVAVQALADRMPYLPIFELQMPKIFSSLLGETNKRFSMALRQVAHSAPAVLFFDEIDTVFQKRESGGAVGGQTDVLMQLQGDLFRFMENEARKKAVVIIAATNRPSNLDEALISRFSVRLPILTPKTEQDRLAIIFSLLDILRERGANIDESVRDATREIARNTNFYSQRDLRNIVFGAANIALSRYRRFGDPKAITGEDLMASFKEVRPPNSRAVEEDEEAAIRFATHK